MSTPSNNFDDIEDCILAIRGLPLNVPAVRFAKTYKFTDSNYVAKTHPVVGEAVARVSMYLSTQKSPEASHPADQLEIASTVDTLTVGPSAITVGAESRSIIAGYAVREDSQEVVARAQIADTISMTYTTRTVDHMISNWTTKSAIALPYYPWLSVPEIAGWKAGSALENSRLVMKSLPAKADALKLQARFCSKIKEDNPLRAIVRDTGCQFKPYVSFPNGNAGYLAVSPPPFVTSKVTYARAYSILSKHREARGEDSTYLSPLTSGYYWCSSPRSLDRTFRWVQDSMTALQAYGSSAVVLIGNVKTSCIYSLNANKITTFAINGAMNVESAKSLTRNKKGAVVFGHRHYVVADIAMLRGIRNLVWYFESGSSTPTLTGTALKTNFSDVKDSLCRAESTYAAGKWYSFVHLSDDLEGEAKKKGWGISYSAHPHSGLCVVTRDRAGKYLYDPATAAQRIVNANICKTLYPYHRHNFSRTDSSAYKVNLQPYSGGYLLLRCNAREPKQGDPALEFGEPAAAKDPVYEQWVSTHYNWADAPPYECPEPAEAPPQFTQVFDVADSIPLVPVEKLELDTEEADFDGLDIMYGGIPVQTSAQIAPRPKIVRSGETNVTTTTTVSNTEDA